MHFIRITRPYAFFAMLLVCFLISSCNNSSLSHATCISWQIMSSPNPGSVDNQLADIFTVADKNIWVSGSSGDSLFGGQSQTLVEHWNGKSWTVVPSQNSSPEPDPDGYPDGLGKIAGSSANDIWAVGYGYEGFLEHWDGSVWKLVDTSIVPWTVYSYQFSSVSSLSPTDAWAVGYTTPKVVRKGNGDLALTAHWDGHVWRAIPNPDLQADVNGTVLNDVVALSSDNVWAVGSTSSLAHGELALVEHWNGKSWSVVASPQPQGTNINNGIAALRSLTVLSSNNIWAGGFYRVSGVDHPLAEHWDGRAWNLIPVPGLGNKLVILRKMVAVSAHNIWALDNNGFLFHWNGSSWNISSFPNTDQKSKYTINSIAALPNGQIWLAGTVSNRAKSGSRTLIARSCP